MADTPPIDTTTSYSDPLYDRLEMAKNQLAKRWWLVVVIAAIVAIAVVTMQQSINTTPAAASAAAYMEAEMSEDPAASLQSLIDNPEITPAFRVRAGIGLAALQQKELKLEEALATLEGLRELTDQSAHVGLSYSLELSKAAITEQQGLLDEALTSYRKIASSTRTSHPAHALTADLGSGRVLLLQSQAAEDGSELRQEAYDILDSVANRRLSGAQETLRLANFMKLNLLRQFPELAGEKQE